MSDKKYLRGFSNFGMTLHNNFVFFTISIY